MNTAIGLLALPSVRPAWLSTLAVVTIPIGSFAVASALGQYLQIYTPNMIFLCGVVLAAMWFGRAVALWTAASSFLVLNFTLTNPRYSLGYNGLNDVLTVGLFLLMAFFIGGLAGALRDERNRSREQVRTLSKLLGASQQLADAADVRSVVRSLADATHQIQGEGAAVFEVSAHEPRLVHAAPEGLDVPAEARERAAVLAATGATLRDDSALAWRVRMIADDSGAGVLAWRKRKGPYASQHEIAEELLLKLAQAALERRRAAAQQVAMKSLEETDRLRTALLSSISHDFRTPLATIIASASSLAAYGVTFSERTRADLLAGIQEEAERLNRFVGNVLDMTRLEAGVLKPRTEWTDPLELIENVRERVAKRAQDRPLTMNAPAALPAVEVDALLLEQALINVIDNAIVHTPSGSAIEIGARRQNDVLHLWVQDTGQGVPASELTHIFDKFYRPANSTHTAGLGLGLAISKALVEAMRGTVKASSPEGRGLRIEFELPSPILAGGL